MIGNALFWADYISRVILPQVDALQAAVGERLLPAFEGVTDEAEEVQRQRWEELMARAHPETDPGDLAEAALEAGIDHYTMLGELKQGLLNMLAVAAFHLLEQHIFGIYGREVLERADQRNVGLYTLPLVVKRFRAQGVDLVSFESWPRVQELRLVANTVKHGEGRSADDLRAARPELFVNPILRDQEWATRGLGQAERPLFGYGLYVTVEELHAYMADVRAFWSELRSGQ